VKKIKQPHKENNESTFTPASTTTAFWTNWALWASNDAAIAADYAA
jgi:hypothetical protein